MQRMTANYGFMLAHLMSMMTKMSQTLFKCQNKKICMKKCIRQKSKSLDIKMCIHDIDIQEVRTCEASKELP